MPSRIVCLFAVLLSSTCASGQYTTDFENLSASASGVPLTGQDLYYRPSPSSSVDFQVFTYAGNTYEIPQNPQGGTQFVVGEGPGSSVYARAQRDISWGPGSGIWTVSYDLLVTSAPGTPNSNDYPGSFSARPIPGSGSIYRHQFYWESNSGTRWRSTYIGYTAAGSSTPTPGLSPGPDWDNLLTDRWYRFTTDIDFSENRITRVTVTDLYSGWCAESELTGIYLRGGATGTSPMPGAFRFFTGGANAGNITAWDNCTMREGGASGPCDPDPCQWSSLEGGMAASSTPRVFALAEFDDGSGPALYAAGSFSSAGGVPANNIARWDGQSWSPLGEGTDGSVSALAVFDDGAGPALFAGGSFTMAGNTSVNQIARWDGNTWTKLDYGVGGNVRALSVYNDGFGPALYVGGSFSGFPGPNIARWDGSNWTAVGAGLNGGVYALITIDDGTQSSLYAGGNFSASGNQFLLYNIARWDGRGWSGLGNGLGGGSVGSTFAHSLTAFDSGSGLDLIAGGDFTRAGTVDANNIARWDGSSWSTLADGVNHDVYAMAPLDDGGESNLYVGGVFTAAGGQGAGNIASWDGSTWMAIKGMNSRVEALAAFDDSSGLSIFAGGAFSMAGDTIVNSVARLGCDRPCYPDCDQSTGTGVLDVFDFLCFQNSFVSAEPYACDCDTSTGNGVCDVFDFLCFQNAFVGGCP